MPEVILTKIHFIEDSDDEVFLTRLLLETQNVNVDLIHHTSKSAFDEYRSTASDFLPALVLVDLNMPNTRGSTVISLERQANASKQLVMGICSGSEDPADKKQCIEAGADFFLQKPFDKNSLVELSQLTDSIGLKEDKSGMTRVLFNNTNT